MNITDNLIRIKEGKENIIKSLKNKGVSISENTLINEIPTIIDNAEIGGGGDTPSVPTELVPKYEGASVFRIVVPEDNYDVFLTLEGYGSTNLINSKFNIDWGDSTDIEELPLTNVNYHKYKYKGYYDINVYNLPDKYTTIEGGSEQNGNNYSSKTVSNIFDNPFNNKQYTEYDNSSGGRFNANRKGVTVQSDDICISVLLNSPITTIGSYAFQNCSSLTSVVIPEGVTTIGSYAFQNCSSLTSVVIPEGVTTIKDEAFRNCTSLTSITIPNSVTTIGQRIFQNCSSLTSVVIPEGLTTINSYAFENCSSLTSVTIPNSVTSIGNSAFSNCSSLTSVVIPEGVTTINSSAFESCENLKYVILPNTITNLNKTAFNYSYSIKTISIPNSITTYTAFNTLPLIEHIIIDKEVAPNFYTQKMNLIASKKYVYVPDNSSGYNEGYWESNGFEVKSINQIPDDVYSNKPTELKYTTTNNIPFTFKDLCLQPLVSQIQNENNEFIATFVDTIYKIPSYQFIENIFIESIVIPEGVTSIDSGAFSGCKNLKNITLPSTLIELKTTFSNCSSLTSVVIPEGVTTINSSAFENCSSLTSVTIPNSVTSIGNSAFSNCSSLTSVVIPEGVTTISGSSFSKCINLSTITCKAMIAPTITSYTFQNIGTSVPSGTPKILRVPQGSSGYDSGYWKSSLLDKGYTLEYIVPNTLTYTSYSGDTVTPYVQSFEGKNEIVSNVYENGIGTITFKEGLSEIYEDMYNHDIVDEITSIEIPNSVTRIGDYSFRSQYLTTLNVPDSVTYIGDSAFNGCSKLTEITLGSEVETIGQWAFASCTQVSTITSMAIVAPTFNQSFLNVGYDVSGDKILRVPEGAEGYDSWLPQLSGFTIEYI